MEVNKHRHKSTSPGLKPISSPRHRQRTPSKTPNHGLPSPGLNERKNNSQQSGMKSTERFAFSKFQCSPDPKELPIPRFLLEPGKRETTSVQVDLLSKLTALRTQLAKNEKEASAPTMKERSASVVTDASQTTDSQEKEESEKIRALKSTFSKLIFKDSSPQEVKSKPPAQGIDSLKEILGLQS